MITSFPFFEELANSNSHILIAGMTGSGKSTIINGMIYSILCKSNEKHQMILIDPKRVELSRYRNLPHSRGFSTEISDIESRLRACINFIEDRFKEMEKTDERFYTGAKLHIFIDEIADLMLTSNLCKQYIQRIAQIGRAANVQLVCATQCPLAKVIPTEIQVNFGTIIGLHTRNAQDSRNILDSTGCEALPEHGEALIRYANKVELERTNIPMVPESEIKKIVEYRKREMEEKGLCKHS